MKKIVLIFSLMVLLIGTSNSVFSQCYDGITQPTTWRFRTPISFNVDVAGRTVNATPFIGYRIDVSSWFTITPVIQYNIGADNVIPQAWLNFNWNKKLWFLSRTGYDSKAEKFYETLSGTWKAPEKFMIDFTWSNFYKGGDLIDQDKLQLLAGRRFDNSVLPFVVNGGYRFRGQGDEGMIFNLRLMVHETNWLQFQYDVANEKIVFSTVIQFN